MALFNNFNDDQNLLVTIYNQNCVYNRDPNTPNGQRDPKFGIQGYFVDLQVDQSLRLGKGANNDKLKKAIDDNETKIAHRVPYKNKNGQTRMKADAPKGALQTNPHLASFSRTIPANMTKDGQEVHYQAHEAFYSSLELAKIAKAAGKYRQAITDDKGKVIGGVYGIKGHLYMKQAREYNGQKRPAYLKVSTNSAQHPLKPTDNKYFGPDTLDMQNKVTSYVQQHVASEHAKAKEAQKLVQEQQKQEQQVKAKAASTINFADPTSFSTDSLNKIDAKTDTFSKQNLEENTAAKAPVEVENKKAAAKSESGAKTYAAINVAGTSLDTDFAPDKSKEAPSKAPF